MPDERSRLEQQRLQVLAGLDLLRPRCAPELDRICDGLRERFQAPVALVTLIDRDQQIIRARSGTTLESSPRAAAFCDHTIRSDEVLVVPDLNEDQRFARNPFVTGEPFVRFYAGAPLIYRGDVRLGGVCVLDTKPRQFTGDERAELTDWAEHVMTVILEDALAAPKST
ncbi:GAF domain-containing protein [Rubellimicrobium arenae]|uniref:GAF domain-containing protein n=1 Tax=Rubellimicrobium arenae TaxID=2817372 RepID=UPI001B316747